MRISMDGKGGYSDNIFVERLWRNVKYEEVYLKAYSSAAEARRDLGDYFRFYNHLRPPPSLGLPYPDRAVPRGTASPGGGVCRKEVCTRRGVRNTGRSGRTLT